MTYPTKIDFDNAVWNLDKTIRCQDFNGGIPRNDDIDLVYYTGGFSRVYLVDLPKPKRTVVLRVWLSDIPDAELLYSQAGKYFEKNPNPYFVNFRYISEGIEVNRKIWPVLYMEWVNGLTLNQFLDQNLPSTPGRVNQVAEQFLEMTKRLHEDQISHGDLQDGNILIANNPTESGQLKLIDYDTLHISGFSGVERQIVGVSGYQHPRRAGKIVEQKKWDYFSELVIYLSLRAYAENPQLWKPQQEKALLFSKIDFNDPVHSPTFETLGSMSNEVRQLSQQLTEYCYENDLNQLQPLENLVSSLGSKLDSSPNIPISSPKGVDHTETQTVVPQKEAVVEPRTQIARSFNLGGVIACSFIAMIVVGCAVLFFARSLLPNSGGIVVPQITNTQIPNIIEESPVVMYATPTMTKLPVATKTPQQETRKYAEISCAEIYFVNLRKTPGYLGKDEATDSIYEIPCGERVELLGPTEKVDGLIWWKISWKSYTGWVAEKTASGKKILEFSKSSSTSLVPSPNPSSHTVNFSVDEPEKFVRWYFTSIWEVRNYEELWSYQTKTFQSHASPSGYSEYVQWWDSVKEIDIIEVSILSKSGDRASVNIVVNFHLKDGRTLSNRSYSYDLSYDDKLQIWQFDRY